MPAGEAIVIHPDVESLASLSGVQGTTTSSVGEIQADDGDVLGLDAATSYDGKPLFTYADPVVLSDIAGTIRNTIGARNATVVSAAPGLQVQKYVKPGVILNALRTTDPVAASARPYVPGATATFTMDLSSGTPTLAPDSYDDSRPAGYNPVQDNAGLTAPAGVGNIFHHIEDFTSHVVKDVEQVGKIAWQVVKDEAQYVVTTVIHTIENEYQLVIQTLEDAVTVVTGFLKAVVTDIKKVVQWLSAMFSWDHILTNHTYIKNAISNPGSSAQPGILDRLQNWLNGELNGTTTDLTSALGGLAPQASDSIGATAQSVAGQTVQTQQSGNSDPNTVYNQGGNNNANQCTWIQQKTSENAAGGSVGAGPVTAVGVASFDPTAILAALSDFLASAEAAVTSDFSNLPGEIETAVKSLIGSFSDPRSLLSTALPDLMTVFQSLARDLLNFCDDLANALLKLLAALLDQAITWLAEPISIPFVSDFYRLITGDQLSLLDLACLLAAVPVTILLEVLTGSPTVPGSTLAGSGPTLLGSAKAGLIATGVASFILSEIGTAMDTFLLGLEVRGSRMPPFETLVNYLDWAVDFAGWGMQMVSAYAWTEWQPQDWVFWGLQGAPQALNFAYLFRADATSERQAERDILFGIMFLVMSATYAKTWPENYRNAPDAPGLVISANVFGNVQAISELIQVDDVENMPVEAVVKMVLATVGNILGLTANMLNATHG
jgi:hypothetical protein